MASGDRVRRIGGAVCLIGAPLVLLVGDVLQLGLVEDDTADQLAQIAESPNRWLASNAAFMVGFVLLIGAVLVLVRLLRAKADGYGLVGGALAVIGLMAAAGIVTVLGPVQWLLTQQQDREAMVSLMDSVDDSARFSLIFIMSIAFFLGVLVLAVGLFRAQATPAWVAGVLGVGIVVEAVGVIGEITVVAIIGDVLLLAALGWIGWTVLQQAGLVDGQSTPPPSTSDNPPN